MSEQPLTLPTSSSTTSGPSTPQNFDTRDPDFAAAFLSYF